MAPTTPLRVHRTIGSDADSLEYALGAAVHVGVWFGGMFLGPAMLCCSMCYLMAEAWFGIQQGSLSYVFDLDSYRSLVAKCLTQRPAQLTVATIFLMSIGPLRESPLFCRLFLRTASLIKGGSTLWVADEVVPHIGDGLMVCYHPHGVIPLGFTLNGAIRAKTQLPRVYLPQEAQISARVSGVQAPVLFKMPILRQILQLFGCSTPATKEGMLGLLRKKMTFGIIVGGSEEVALFSHERERLFLRKRAGFVKYALQHGTKLVIAYNFGESDLYRSVEATKSINLWLVKTFGFVLPLFCGRWWCPLLPIYKKPLNTVFGHVLELPRIDNPTPEEVAKWHGRYIQEVEKVFDTYKDQFGYGGRSLEIL